MDALIGKADKAYFIGKYGPPDKQASLSEGVDFWEYRSYDRKVMSPTGHRFSTFDRVRLTFTRGILTEWSAAGVME